MTRIIAVDFDGTLCYDAWPGIGRERKDVLEYILYRQRMGDRLILWTNREGKRLEAALDWCEKRGLRFDTVNENLPWVEKRFGSDSRKIFADEYIDDKAIPADAVERGWRKAKYGKGAER